MSTEMKWDGWLTLSEKTRKKIVASASPEERLAGLTLEERLTGLTPEELRQLLLKHEYLRKAIMTLIPLDERLASLSQQELLALREQIEARLKVQPPISTSKT